MAKDKDVWMYNPSVALAIIGTVVAIRPHFHSHHLLDVLPVQSMVRYFTVVVVGAAVEVAGYVLRAYSAKNRTILVVPFVLTLNFTVLAPVFIAAGNYILISRLIRAVLPPSHHRILGVPGKRLTPIFVICDIVSFIFQGQWFCDRQLRVLAGREGEDWSICPHWRTCLPARRLWAVPVRCIYRVCEFAEGTNGYAFRTEWPFWVLETLPMTDAIGIFIIYHPSRFLGENGAAQPKEARGLTNPCDLVASQGGFGRIAQTTALLKLRG
ncbi:RTM1-like protein [Metarhizium rileyi]|uniref:RTM1-like protein n=1 Tax=Metarhizium rileyi (strain RCEF 4871) TaxID=1649241 RepID=A0A167KHX2_METRR|nr:RTM1-like protein [Metarhizium rileyi RCEF 4871]